MILTLDDIPEEDRIIECVDASVLGNSEGSEDALPDWVSEKVNRLSRSIESKGKCRAEPFILSDPSEPMQVTLKRNGTLAWAIGEAYKNACDAGATQMKASQIIINHEKKRVSVILRDDGRGKKGKTWIGKRFANWFKTGSFFGGQGLAEYNMKRNPKASDSYRRVSSKNGGSVVKVVFGMADR